MAGALDDLYFSLKIKTDDIDSKEAKEAVAKAVSDVEAKITRLTVSQEALSSLQGQLSKTGLTADVNLKVNQATLNESVKTAEKSINQLKAEMESAKAAYDRMPGAGSYMTTIRRGDRGYNENLDKAYQEYARAYDAYEAAKKKSAASAADSTKVIAETEKQTAQVTAQATAQMSKSFEGMATRLASIAKTLLGTFKSIADGIRDMAKQMSKSFGEVTDVNKVYREKTIEAIAVQRVLEEAAAKRRRIAAEEKATRDESKKQEKEAAEAKKKAAKEAAEAAKKASKDAADAAMANVKRAMTQIVMELNRIKSMGVKGGPVSSYIQQLKEMYATLKGVRKGDAVGFDLSPFTGESWSKIVDGGNRAISEQAAKMRELNKLVQDRAIQESIVNKQLNRQSYLTSQLKNMLMMTFSVYTVQNFVRSLIQVGGEFEKQHLALQGILGDIREADHLFGQIKSLSIKSPFQFKELTSYARQLAAFSIPTEEIYDTTKRLADISAGLGVDMSRIILAYGQVRAAEFLRGQELRQFTEAGIPMVDALAKKFTELEGSVVSAGDVFSRITKKQVSFEMVKDVLFEMTNEGGRFYKMQEVLAESIAGRWSNLKDAYDIMLSEIAEGNNGPIKASIDMIATLMRTYKTWGSALMSLVTGYGLYRTTMAISNRVTAFSIAWNTKHTRSLALMTDQELIALAVRSKYNVETLKSARNMAILNKQVGAASMTWSMWLGVVAAAGMAIYSVYRHMTEFERSLDEIDKKFNSQAAKEISSLNILYERIKDTTEGTIERKEAVDEMYSRFGTYLPKLDEEADKYNNIAAAVDAARKAIKAKADQDRYQAKVEKYQERYQEDVSDAVDEISERIRSSYRQGGDKISNATATSIAERFVETLTSRGGNLNDDEIKKTFQELQKVFDLKFSSKVYSENGSLGVLVSSAQDALKATRELDEALEDLGSGKNIDSYTKKIKDIEDAWEEERKSMKTSDDEDAARLERVNEIRKVLASVPEELKVLYTDVANKYDEEFKRLTGGTEAWEAAVKQTVKNIEQIMSNIKNPQVVIDVKVKDGEGFLDYAKRMSKLYSDVMPELENDIKFLETSSIASEDEKKNLPYYKDLLAELNRSKEEFKFESLDSSSNNKKGGSGGSKTDKEADRIRERVRALKEAFDQYEKLAKLVGSDEANRKMAESPLFSAFFGDGFKFEGKESLRAGLNQIMDELSNIKDKKKKEKLRLDILKEIFGLDEYNIEKTVQDASDKIGEALKDAQEEWKRYKSIADSTGDETLASKLIFGDKGATGFEQHIKDTFNKFATGYDYDTIEKNGFASLPEHIKNAFKSAREAIRQYNEDERNQADQLLSRWQTLEDKMKKLAWERDEALRRINNSLLPESEKEIAREKINANYDLEAMKNSDEYYTLFNASLAMTRDEIRDVSTLVAQKLTNAFNKGAISVEEYTSQMKALESATNSLLDRGRVANPFTQDFATQLEKRQQEIRDRMDEARRSGDQGALMSANEDYVKLLGALNAENTLQDIFDGLNRFSGILNDASDLLGVFGDGISNVAEDFSIFMGTMTKGKNVGSEIGSFFGPLGGVVGGAVGTIVGAISGIAKVHDNRLNRSIEKSKKKVKELQGDYESLARIISRQLGGIVEEQAEEQLKNLEKQRDEVMKMYNAEEDKKKTDESALNDYKSELEELEDQIKYFYEDLAKERFGVDLESWADQLAGALVEAFQQGQDAAKAFDDTVSDILKGLVTEAISLQFLQPSMDKIREYLTGTNGILTPDSAEGINATAQELAGLMPLFGELKDAYNSGASFFEQANGLLGGALLGGESGSLSSSIASITEDTADLLASYVNAIRADVSYMRGNDELVGEGMRNYYTILAPQQNAIATSQLQQLQSIAVYTERNALAAESLLGIMESAVNGIRPISVSA